MENCTQNEPSRVSPTLPIRLTDAFPPNTVALFKLPLPIPRMTALCEMFRTGGYEIGQLHEWIVVTQEGGPA